uniref:FBA_2 domain-containing protein n=1 Tax=Steinernema glaseri TaxID=37863 RepID=A0A1I7ZTE0_9BILA
MEGFSADVVRPICALVRPESLSHLKAFIPARWSGYIDDVLASRFNLFVTVKYLKDSDRMQLSLIKEFLSGKRANWTLQDTDAFHIDALVLTVSQTEPGMEDFHPNQEMSLVECFSKLAEALPLMNFCRKVDITIEQLDEYPSGLLDLLPQKSPLTKVYLDTSRCPILPPLDLPIRMNLSPFFGRRQVETLMKLQGAECLRWLVQYWRTHSDVEWDSEISIPMLDCEIWKSEVTDFKHEPYGTYYQCAEHGYLYVRHAYEERVVRVIATQERNIESLVLLFGTISFAAILILLVSLRSIYFV